MLRALLLSSSSSSPLRACCWSTRNCGGGGNKHTIRAVATVVRALLVTIIMTSTTAAIRTRSSCSNAFTCGLIRSYRTSRRTHAPSSSLRFSTSSASSSGPPPPPLQPPDPSEFPDWAYEEREFFRFEILHRSTKSRARVGRIHTPHGVVDTPGFVAVATNAALKGVDFRTADGGDNDGNNNGANQQLVFANTYHLMLHPGPDIIEEAGGIHKFTNRLRRPFITDSGGFQVFSLAYGSVHEELTSKGELKKSAGVSSRHKRQDRSDGSDAVKVSEEGVVFRSYRDGSKFLLTPEATVQAQKKIGADIIVPLDELPGYYVDRNRLVESVGRTHRWEARSLVEHLKDVRQQAMFCVVHGGVDFELRKRSVDYLTSLPFDGYAIGGSLGNGREELKELLTWLMPMFDDDEDTDDGSVRGRREHKPRHLLGIADEESIRNAVPLGIDTLDSCYPTVRVQLWWWNSLQPCTFLGFLFVSSYK